MRRALSQSIVLRGGAETPTALVPLLPMLTEQPADLAPGEGHKLAKRPVGCTPHVPVSDAASMNDGDRTRLLQVIGRRPGSPLVRAGKEAVTPRHQQLETSAIRDADHNRLHGAVVMHPRVQPRVTRVVAAAPDLRP